MLEDKLHKIFQNYISEFLLTIDDVKEMRAAMYKVYKDKDTMLSYLKTHHDSVIMTTDDISDELFESSKLRTFKELDAYEAKLK